MDTAWLIEINTKGSPGALWWGGGGCRHWVADANLAVRFCRKADAERVISMLGLNGAVALAHGWDNV